MTSVLECQQYPYLILPTGQTSCYDQRGAVVPCLGSGQDADRPNINLSDFRFITTNDGPIKDSLTGILWYPKANAHDFPLTFAEALDAVMDMNKSAVMGRKDWRVPTRPELRSILSHGNKNPALPKGHPFTHVFLGRYWTATTFAGLPDHAWYVHLEGARVFYERKDRYCLVWPVAGHNPKLSSSEFQQTLQTETRFVGIQDNVVMDQRTGLSWLTHPLGSVKGEGPGFIHWQKGLSLVADLAQKTGLPWCVPDINELESLVDLSQAYPALSKGHPFVGLEDGLWSSTTSGYDPAWSYVLYLGKGAVGVGFKANAEFLIWPVLRHLTK